jgi:hypothetical protein
MLDNKVEYRRQHAISKVKLKKLIKDLKTNTGIRMCNKLYGLTCY